MGFLAHVQLSCFLFSYLVSMGAEVFQLLRGRSRVTRICIVGFTAAGLLAHSAYLTNRSLAVGLPPLVGSSHDWLLVLAWTVALPYLFLAASSHKSSQGLFLTPAVIVLTVLALFVDDRPAAGIREVALNRWGMLHAATLVLGIAAVAASTITAGMYLLQHQKLRGRKSVLHRLQLPNLEQLTSWNRWLVAGSVPMLTIGLLTGFILTMQSVSGHTATGVRWSDPLVTATIAVWAAMVVALIWLLTQKEQTGRQVARMTLLAGGFLLVSVLGLMLLTGGIHSSRPSADVHEDGGGAAVPE